MSDITLVELSEAWDESVGEPRTLHESSEPAGQAGMYVIRPGERVPEEGWTSHDGDEMSVVLSGEVQLVTKESEITVSEGTVSVIPAGVEHVSINESDQPVRLVYAVFGDL